MSCVSPHATGRLWVCVRALPSLPAGLLECACAVAPTRRRCGRAKHFLAFMARSGTGAVAAKVTDAHLVHGLLTKQTHQAKYAAILLTTATVRAIEAYHCHITDLIDWYQVFVKTISACSEIAANVSQMCHVRSFY